jgi:hypothetical protein
VDNQEKAIEALENALAIQDELLPSPEDAYGMIGAEMRDAMLCFDRAAYDAAQAQADEVARTYTQLRALWLQAKEAREADFLERIPETAAAIRHVAETDFRRRNKL